MLQTIDQGNKMIVLKVALIVVGLMSSLFGFFIYFKQKYNLINGFEDDLKAGRKTEEYAEKVGMIEFVLGIVILVVALVMFIFVR